MRLFIAEGFKAFHHDEFDHEKLKNVNGKIDNVTDKNREGLFGHLIEGDPKNETQINLIKE